MGNHTTKVNKMDAKNAAIWENPDDASNYDQARPDYPVQVVEKSVDFLRKQYEGPLSMALDIGCGTGKSTEHLIPLFENVVGCDPSLAMLEEARKNYSTQAHVKFIQANAEDLSMLPSNSIQLILASRCIHYFDHKKFYEEVDRLLVPNGVLVYYTLQFEEIHHPTESKKLLTDMYDEYLENWVGDYWSQPKYLPDGFKYKARNRKEYYLEILQPPYPESKTIEIFTTNRMMTLSTLRNLLQSYSATLNHREAHGDKKTDDLINKCIGNIKNSLEKSEEKDENVKIKVSNEFFMVLSQKSIK